MFIPFLLESTEFKPDSGINVINSCESANESPDLSWSGAPKNTQSFALILDDPDAPTAEPFVHWIVYNIPPTVSELSHALPRTPKLDNGASQGLNTFEQIGYDGPCPPLGSAHRYFFTLYALDTMLPVEPGLTKKQLLEKMAKHIIEKTSLTGTYKRLKETQSPHPKPNKVMNNH